MGITDQPARAASGLPNRSSVRITWTRRRAGWLRGKQDFVEMRDARLGADSPVELFDLAEWFEFCQDAPRRVSSMAGNYRVGRLSFSTPDWAAFCDQIRAGDYRPTRPVMPS